MHNSLGLNHAHALRTRANMHVLHYVLVLSVVCIMNRVYNLKSLCHAHSLRAVRFTL